MSPLPATDGDPERGSVWVASDLSADHSTYMLAVHFDPDTSVSLTPEAATAYGMTVLAACARCEYEGAVVKQMTGKVGAPVDAVAQLVADMRNDQPPLDSAATAPLALTPSVSAKTLKPYLAVSLHGQDVGRWDPADARQHALHVLEGVEIVRLDGAYRRVLVEQCKVEPARALNVVDDLANYRS